MKSSLCVLLGGVVLLVGCGGTGVDNRSGDDGGLNQSVAVVNADWLVVDLQTGTAEAHQSLGDLATNPAYRTSQMVLRRVSATSTTLGSAPGSRWAQSDETPGTASLTSYFMGVFEVTRGQWRHLAASTPWREVVPAALAGLADDDHLPACGLSLVAVEAACAAWTKTGRWSVPGASQWEGACRAGSATLFAWGDQTDETTVARFAVVRPTAGGVEGPWPVGLREANLFGMYDMHGNVWEWTSDGDLHGGSWNDGLPLARSANRLTLDRSTAHALAGVRLVYVP